jgi:putative redox protein
MKATINLDHGMTFHGSANSGYTLQMDSTPSFGGDDSGFRPMELLLIGLGGCTAMDVLSILRKKRQEVTGFDVNVDARQAKDHPHIFTEITVSYIVRGRDINPKAVERAILLSETKYCPAQAMLAMAATIEHTYEIIEEE